MKEVRKNNGEQSEGIEELRIQLFEANCIIDAIKEGAIDALVLNKGGGSNIYALESADYTYRLLVEKSGEGAISISPSGLVLYCNEYFATLVGLPANNIIGTYFNSYVDSVGQFQQLKTALELGPSKGEIILSIDGRKLHVYASLTSLQPQVAAIGIIITDLTEKRKHEDALAAYRRELELKVNELNRINMNLEQFIHVITHDIKEPLRKITLYSQQLTNDKIPSDECADELKKLATINGAAARLNLLVDDLVKYALSSAQADHEEVDLNLVIKEVAEDMALFIEEKKAQLTARLLPKVSGSAVQMRQLFYNLISNSIKYAKAEVPAKIFLACDIEDCIDKNMPNRKFYCVSIHDNGIGMDMEQTGKVFTIFHRVHTNGEYSGNGIGLSICKKIVENHSGKIEVDSSPGDGSTFRIYLPFPG